MSSTPARLSNLISLVPLYKNASIKSRGSTHYLSFAARVGIGWHFQGSAAQATKYQPWQPWQCIPKGNNMGSWQLAVKAPVIFCIFLIPTFSGWKA